MLSIITTYFSDVRFGWITTLIIMIYLILTCFWWFSGIVHWFYSFNIGTVPPHFIERLFFIVNLILISVSSFMFFILLSWVILGALLNPLRLSLLFTFLFSLVLSYVFSAKQVFDQMNLIETQLRAWLMKVTIEEYNKLQFQINIDPLAQGIIYQEELVNKFKFTQKEAKIARKYIAKFYAFKTRYLISTVLVKMLVLCLLATFLFVGLSSFGGFDNVSNIAASTIMLIGTYISNATQFIGDTRSDILKYLRYIYRHREKYGLDPEGEETSLQSDVELNNPTDIH